MRDASVPLSLSCNFCSIIQTGGIWLGFSWKLSMLVLVATSIIILEILTFWLKRKEGHLGCFCILLGTGWQSFGTIAAVCDLERAVLRLLKSVLEIQLTKGLHMERFFPSRPKKSDIGESMNQLVRGTKAWRWCSFKKEFSLYSCDFHLANHGAVLRCLCVSVIWDALGHLTHSYACKRPALLWL